MLVFVSVSFSTRGNRGGIQSINISTASSVFKVPGEGSLVSQHSHNDEELVCLMHN